MLLLSYDGSAYHGWQVQKSHHTIEAELEQALATLTQQTTKVLGAGRTDAGVHALNQTANFFSAAPFTADKWRAALNGVLPSDLVVKHVLSVPDEFHARHSAIAKRYRYLIYNKPYPSPFANPYSWWVRRPLNLEAMREAATHLLGSHDFSAFRASRCSSPSPVKHLQELEIQPITTSSATLSLEVQANSFLQYMVRIIVGTLVDVGLESYPPDRLKTILESRDRRQSGKTAPAHGLYVLQVVYGDPHVEWPSHVIDL